MDKDTLKHIYMQDKMFPDWRKYWIYKDGEYIKRDNKNKPLARKSINIL